MQNSTPTPHDAIFKTFLSNTLHAQDFLELHLPEELREICDLDTLRLESGSFVEDDLRACYSDILYSLKTTRGDGYAYILIEHQSSPDRMMPFRLLRYAIAAMQRHMDAGHKMLPLVIPVLFYQGGRSPYPYSMSWLDLFSEPRLAAKLYGGRFPLVDITVIPDDEILKHRRVALLTLLQKHIRIRDLHDLFNEITQLMQSDELSGQQQAALINYMIQAGETPDVKGFLHELAQALPQHKDELMTIAKRLEEMGREQGLQVGLEQGLEQGRSLGHQDGEREASLKIARTMLEKGFDRAAVMEVTGLSEDDLRQIKH
ncbi:putative transposase/invertase (TIGR01784 family) [Erwinia persicina]|uniref:Rpn family recombination-promoting nuclease/putative transposase n=1 Tax=Erwinia TaxID=551 RepID=UPI0020A11CD3|nr:MULTISPECIES: Rpn family recombination-promoting nuclease/putative transposase [Erwinia]MCP1436874.1 putative transposase/invertase (TIGR01784 family) [Erwinia persicina]MDN8540242.1 Rpn family recombination-promoting nuclease/putative transposase [Erwinia sp. BC051422]